MYNFVFLVILFAVAQSNGTFELNIIHFNDFHAHFEEVSPGGTVCNPAEDPCIGGFARLYTAIRQAKLAEPDSLVLNGGDTFQGTIWYNFLRWNVSQHFMNMIPHDAHVLGNHEFDHGVEGLVPYLRELNAPMLAANVNTTLEPSMTPYIKNHVVVTRNGRRIGIIGVLLTSFTAPIGNVILEDEVTAVNREAAILNAERVDIIIVLSHVGYDSDINMATRISPSVDIIVGAHSHTLLFTGEAPNGDTARGNYPTVVTRDDGHRILIVQASAYTRYLGNIKLFFDSNGIIQSWQGEPVFLGTSIVQDQQMLIELEPWRRQVDSVGKEVLGVSKVTLNRSWCSSRECNMGSWACDGFLEEMMNVAQPTGTAWHHVHLCLVNSGGLRVQINPGEVTTESLLMAMPFENYVQTYDLKGQYVLEALEHAVGTYQDGGQFSSSRMVQVGGMRVVFNASMQANSRVVSASVRCIDCDIPVYSPIDPEATYRVVSQDYIADGGSGFTMLSEHRQNVVNHGVDYTILQNYMRRRQGPIMKDLDGRVQLVY